jgi:hypothetical protein
MAGLDRNALPDGTRHRVRTLIALLALLVAGLALSAAGASALPCQTCDPPDPPDDGPVITTQSITRTLTVSTERGRVTDGVAIDCPAVACTREFRYSRTCVDGACEPYDFATATLTLTPVDGFTATWSGCTPQPADPAHCEVVVDANRTVSVAWTPNDTGGPAVDPEPTTTGGGDPTQPGTAPPASDGRTETIVEEQAPEVERVPGRRRPIRSTLRYVFRRTDAWTEFTALAVRHLPRGATVAFDCRGTRCPDPRARAASGRTMRLTSLTHIRFRAGNSFKIRVSKPGRLPRVTLVRVRFGKAPLITHPRR